MLLRVDGTMKIYIAAPFAARDLVRDYAERMEKRGHECTSTWASTTREINDASLGASWITSEDAAREHAEGDLKDIDRSNAMMHLTAEHCLVMGVEDRRLHTGGRHTELGYALASDIPVIVVGTSENIFQRSLCYWADDFEEAIAWLETNPPAIYAGSNADLDSPLG